MLRRLRGESQARRESWLVFDLLAVQAILSVRNVPEGLKAVLERSCQLRYRVPNASSYKIIASMLVCNGADTCLRSTPFSVV